MENEIEKFRIMFKSIYNQYNKREETYKINFTKAYGLYLGKCSKGMRNKIKA
jgi:hypothetical protein